MFNPFKNFDKEFHERIGELHKLGGFRILILHVIDEHGPANGVEIMDAIENHQESFGFMSMRHRGFKSPRPSPGSIYPMLKKMVDEELLNKGEDGKYSLTEKGEGTISKLTGRLKKFKNMNRSDISINNALTELDGYISYLEDIKTEKLAKNKEMLVKLGERLNKINESL